MEEALIKRVMPHSIEAEQSVVGAMLMDKDAILTASELISGQDFYQSAYGVIFDSMVELFNEGRPVDLVTLQDRLKEKDVPPEISSLEFVRDIITTVPTSANVKSYAGIVREKAVLRRLIKVNEEIAGECYLGREPLDSHGERRAQGAAGHTLATRKTRLGRREDGYVPPADDAPRGAREEAREPGPGLRLRPRAV